MYSACCIALVMVAMMSSACFGMSADDDALIPDGPDGSPDGLHRNKFIQARRRRIRYGRGSALATSDCDNVITIPDSMVEELQIDGSYYRKYTHAYGIPIVSSDAPVDAALTRACYVVRFLLADRKDIRDAMFNYYSRIVVIGSAEKLNGVPEYTYLDDSWNRRARGLGGTPFIPVTSNAEENILCKPGEEDDWYEEDVLVHEVAHAIQLIGLQSVERTCFSRKVIDLFRRAKAAGLWAYTYAGSKDTEYFAEGVQAYFNVQTKREGTDGIHNHVGTRQALYDYDRPLYYLIEEVFPCKNFIVDRCVANQATAIEQQPMLMDCNWM